MALLLVEGFDNIDTATLSQKGWAVSGQTVGSAYGRFAGSQGVSLANYQGDIQAPIPASNTVILGFAICPLTNAYPNVAVFSSTSNQQIAVRMDWANSRLRFLRGDSTVLASTNIGSMNLSGSAWQYLEVKIYFHSSAGTIDCHVNGVSAMTPATGLVTQYGAVQAVTVVTIGGHIFGEGGLPMNVDDLYICDDTGTTNNTFLGDVRVLTLMPTGAGGSTQFTPSAGSNYACVNEVPPNGDTSYVESSTVGNIDYYAMADLSVVPATIFGVQVDVDMEKTDAGARTGRTKLISSAAVTNGATVAPSAASYAYAKTIVEKDPNTTAAWTYAGVNAAQAGVEVVA